MRIALIYGAESGFPRLVPELRRTLRGPSPSLLIDSCITLD